MQSNIPAVMPVLITTNVTGSMCGAQYPIAIYAVLHRNTNVKEILIDELMTTSFKASQP
jgi:hypothetical protein